MRNRTHVFECHGDLPSFWDGVNGTPFEMTVEIHPMVGVIEGCGERKADMFGFLIDLEKLLGIARSGGGNLSARYRMISMARLSGPDSQAVRT